eukprot:6226480-Pyramimonas_sp.AAC.1
MTSFRCPPATVQSSDSFAARSPAAMERPNIDLRMTSLRWASQQPPKLAIVSHFATSQPRGGSNLDLFMTSLRWPPSSLRKWRQLRSSSRR